MSMENVTLSKQTYNELMKYISGKALNETYTLFTKATAEVKANELKTVRDLSENKSQITIPKKIKAPTKMT